MSDGSRNVEAVYAKLLCHKLCCVIMSQIELGIEPVFWKELAMAQSIAV